MSTLNISPTILTIDCSSSYYIALESIDLKREILSCFQLLAALRHNKPAVPRRRDFVSRIHGGKDGASP